MENAKIFWDSFSWSKIDSKNSDKVLEVFKKDDNKDFRLVQEFTMCEADFYQFMRVTNQLVIAAENLVIDENLSPVVILTLSRDKDEQLKLAQKLAKKMDRANRESCVTLPLYNLDKLESSYAQIRLLHGRRRTRKFNNLSKWIMNLKNLPIYLM